MIDEDTIPPQIGSATLPLFAFDILTQNSQQQSRSAQKFRRGADTFVLSEPGQPYQIKVFNNSPDDITVQFDVDGSKWNIHYPVDRRSHRILDYLPVSRTVVGDQCHETRVGFAFGKPVLEHKSVVDADEDEKEKATEIGLIRMRVYRCEVHEGVQDSLCTFSSQMSEAKAPETKKFFHNPLCTQYVDLGRATQLTAKVVKRVVDWSAAIETLTCYYKTRESLVLMGLMKEDQETGEEADERPELEPIPEPLAPPRVVKPEPESSPASLKRSLQQISRSNMVKKEPKGKKQRVLIVISDEEDDEEENPHTRQPVREVDLTQA